MRLILEPTQYKNEDDNDGALPRIIIETRWDAQTDLSELREQMVTMLQVWGWQKETLEEVFGKDET